MKNYMVIIKLPPVMTKKFINLIPAQRAKIDALMAQGIICNYSLAMDRSMLWTTIAADSEIKVMEILAEFPLINFMKPAIFELAFHHSVFYNLHSVSLN